MVAVDPGEIFIENIIAGWIKIDQNTENHDVPDNEDFDDDAKCFTTGKINSINATGIYGNHGTGPGKEREADITNRRSENGANLHNLRPTTPRSQCQGI